MFKTLKGLKEAKKIVKEFKPDIVIGTGGFICGPVLMAAKKYKIPTILHESNAFPGKAVTMLAKKTDCILYNVYVIMIKQILRSIMMSKIIKEISKVDKYHLEDCFGMCGDWLNKCATPILSVEPLKKKKTLKKSKISEDRKRKAEYDAAFKAGGCTPGDMDITRHRDVYYDNTFPCGMRCPHCGTFWVD